MRLKKLPVSHKQLKNLYYLLHFLEYMMLREVIPKEIGKITPNILSEADIVT
jgi:hypothetical protein